MFNTKDSGKSRIVVTVNTGSTSVKLCAFDARGGEDAPRLAHQQYSGEDLSAPELIRSFLAKLPGAPAAMAHRVVHGGTEFRTPVLIDGKVAAAIGRMSDLAPLHNAKALQWVEAARSIAGPDVAQIAAFDTSFFVNLPRVAGEYALARRFGVDAGVRRYGFHGLAHEALWGRWLRLNPQIEAGGRVITLQLGGGCSATAIDRGTPLDTSMGFSPLEGLVMATRSGDVDPAVVPYLQRRLGMSSDQVVDLLNRQSGVAGMAAGETDLARLAADPDDQAQHAFALYCYRVRKYIGAFIAVLGGCDGIVFGGGVGEHVPAVRAAILAGMGWAGIGIDEAANEAARGREARIDRSGGVRIYVVPGEEESILIRSALTVLKAVD